MSADTAADAGVGAAAVATAAVEETHLTPLHARRAVEALRAGVPNRDAVRALGALQPQLEERFRQQLTAMAAGGDDPDAGRPPTGLLIAGDFGDGKSHLLEYFQHLALEARFVCSKVVISKETPLYDPAKLYRAAVQSAIVPGKTGWAVTEIAASLDPAGAAYADLVQWVNRPETGLNARFPATLFLYSQVKDPEVQDRIIALWSGDPLNVGQLRAWLRAQGEAATYKLESVPARELPLQRFKFLARLIVAAGYAGWVLLVDEVELIGRYSFKRRARSYAELARWAGKLPGQAFPGLSGVFALTADFDSAVLQNRNDAEAIPGKLRASGVEADRVLAGQAERGMRLIAREAVRLRPPGRAALEAIRARVRAIHGQAYGWSPPALDDAEQLATTRMREYVRRWITAWDLQRLYPGYAVQTVAQELRPDYSENTDLEAPAEGDLEGDAERSV